MPKYRVLRGTYRRDDGTRAEPGDIIEISEERRDRLPAGSYERIEDDEATDESPAPSLSDVDTTTDEAESDADVEISPGADVAPEPAETEEVEASGDVPDDYTLLSKMAKHYDGEEVHGSSSHDDLTEFFGELSDTEVAHLKESARAELEEE